jgi:hypothetical protein
MTVDLTAERIAAALIRVTRDMVVLGQINGMERSFHELRGHPSFTTLDIEGPFNVDDFADRLKKELERP